MTVKLVSSVQTVRPIFVFLAGAFVGIFFTAWYFINMMVNDPSACGVSR